MKNIKSLILVAVYVFFSVAAFAQIPAAMNYQAVLRNASGAIMANQNVGVRISIINGTPTSTTVLYSETRTATTTAQGLLNIEVGDGTATSTTGAIQGIRWIDSSKYLKIELDPAGGTAYADFGTTKLVTVPYAFMSNGLRADNAGGDGIRGGSNLWLGLYESNTYRGYLGSYSGKAEDVDFGTGAGNTLGSLNLTIGATPKVTIDSIGNMGVGTRFPKYRFQVDGITGTFTDNGIRIQNTSASTGWSFYASSGGDMIIGKTGNLGTFNGTTGAYTTVSDARLKQNITDMEPILTKLTSLKAKRYEYKFNNPEHKQSIGFIAQDIQALFPEFVAVNTTNEGNPMVPNQLSVDYAGLSTLAIKALQEQQSQIEDLKARIAQLEQVVNSLKK